MLHDADITTIADTIGSTVTAAVAPVRDRVLVLETKVATPTPDPQLATLRAEVATLRERLAVLETRAPVPGPAGADGRDGADGLGFDDLDLHVDDARGCFLRLTAGARSKEFYVPVPFFMGAFHADRAYTKGHTVLHGGGLWIARADTCGPRPGAGATAWQLATKPGRDGKDARQP
jgi:hypothetical protein